MSKEKSSLDGKIVFMGIRSMDLIWINILTIQKYVFYYKLKIDFLILINLFLNKVDELN
jgi:hypothetical protein